MVTKALVRPFALFAHEPIVQLLGVYMAFIYGIFYRTSFYKQACLGDPTISLLQWH
jgi:hypothetical protein